MNGGFAAVKGIREAVNTKRERKTAPLLFLSSSHLLCLLVHKSVLSNNPYNCFCPL